MLLFPLAISRERGEVMFYIEDVGEVVSQTYEVEAGSWWEAKVKAFPDMKEGDILAECEEDGIVLTHNPSGYSYIKPNKCLNYARLCCGSWFTGADGSEYFDNSVWWFSDDVDTYFDICGNGLY